MGTLEDPDRPHIPPTRPGAVTRPTTAVIPATVGAWRTSSHSNEQAECVEVAPLTGPAVGVRDSKHPTGGTLTVTDNQWQHLLHAVRHHPTA